MLKTKITHNDVVVGALLSITTRDWRHMREIETVREEMTIDPECIADSLSEVERSMTPHVKRLLLDGSNVLLSLLKRGDPHVRQSIDLLKRNLPELPYYERDPSVSECVSFEYMVFNAFPWMIYLMITDPSL